MADIDNKEPSELDQDLDDVKKVEEEETGDETKIKAHQLTFQMMQNPQILQLFKKDLMLTGYTESLPRVVKRQVNEVHNLERKYAVLCQPLFDKWFEIINAIYEPTEEISEELKEKAKIEDEKKDEEKEDAKGMPEFWLIVFKNVDLLSDIESMLQERDEPILKHLEDIKVKFSDAGQPTSFVLEFHFETNEYFKNEVLTKTYRMRSEPDDSDPFYFDGPETMGFTGCQIDWKKERIRSRETRDFPMTLSLIFFAPPEVSESGDLDDAAEAILAADFEIGHFLPECIIRGSVLYFTGEATEEDDDYDEEGVDCMD
uniref:Nucleosome assembly protein 1 like 1 n=1 Tax=Rhinopithecus bieti TaxID=61621 RepID=A0A2K6LLL0_RHIBE